MDKNIISDTDMMDVTIKYWLQKMAVDIIDKEEDFFNNVDFGEILDTSANFNNRDIANRLKHIITKYNIEEDKLDCLVIGIAICKILS